MRTLESFLSFDTETPYGRSQWTWKVQLLSLKTLMVSLVGPGALDATWTGYFGYPTAPSVLDYVEADTKEVALQGLETKLLEAFPELRGMLYPPPPKAALTRIWAEESPF